VALNDIGWFDYKVFCISGGEPLLDWAKVAEVVARIPKGRLIILYTNGILLNKSTAQWLADVGVAGVNVGLHNPASFASLIRRISVDTFGIGLHVRFHANEIYKAELEREFPFDSFRFWKMDDCDRANEERVIVNDWSRPVGLTI
jgi:uncharacterized Fe-S cluster-containing radical SAM superfamily protein